MAMWSKRGGLGVGAAEPLGYAAAAITVFIVVTAALKKLGVEPDILIWSSCLVFSGIVLLASNTSWPSRLATFAVADRRSSPSMISCGQLMAFGPSGLAIAFLTDNPNLSVPVYLTVIGLLVGMWLSTLLVGVRLNRSGAYSLPQYLQVRFGSVPIRLMSVLLLVPSVLVLVGGQFVAFGLLSESFIGIPYEIAVLVCGAFVVILCWPNGSRGILLAGMVCVAALMIVFAPVYWEVGGQLAAVSDAAISGNRSTKGAVLAASPMLFEAELMQAGLAKQTVHIAAFATAVAVSPMCTVFHPMSASGAKTVRAALAASVLMLAFAALAIAVAPLGAAFPFDRIGGIADGWLFGALACVVILLILPVTAATLLFGLVGLLTFDGAADLSGAPKAENRHLIWSRLAILLVALGVGYGAMHWRNEFAGFLAVPVFVSAAALFPVSVAAFWWQRCTAPAALTGIIAGAVIALLVWSLGAGIVETQGLVSGGSAVLDFLSGQSVSGAALFGLAGGTISMIAIALGSGLPKPETEALFESVSEDRPRRPLNENTL